jgi:thioredoxin reductase (NADPH)
MARIEASREEMFPSLSPGEIDRLRRFGAIRRYAADEPLFMTGDIRSGMFVLVSGSVSLSARDALGHVLPIVELGPGGFLAEVGMLAGQPRLVDARAIFLRGRAQKWRSGWTGRRPSSMRPASSYC